ncbi:tyrosine-type recombinase/integrase [Geodermatophilus sp. CPCC 206100]|uniref:tyrosine-type recombinase/integrase n=1 Tax=Geodermatophilus sp. CPCC 206100 TaxID=3020054 RepID=UPI003B00A513
MPGRARKALREKQLPVIRLHDLRHTHATLQLADGVPVKVVSERLGHASATITLTVHQHVHPGMGRQAAERFAALLDGGSSARSITGVSSLSRPAKESTPAS